jgi:beta-lactamase class A
MDGPALGQSSRGSRKQQQQKRFQTSLTILVLVAVLALAVWIARPLWIGTEPADTTGQTTLLQTSQSDTQSEPATTGPTTGVTPTPGMTTTLSLPTPAPTMSAAERQRRLAEAGDAVTALLQSNPSGRFGVYFENLTGGETWTYQEEQPFVAASSIKLALNTLFYIRIAQGQIRAEEILVYDSRPYPTGDYESGTGILQGMPNGTRLTAAETSSLSIRISDNCATNMVIRRLGGIDAINPWLNEISGQVDYRLSVTYKNYAGQTQSGRHRTCARDLGLHAVNLYRLWLADPPAFEPLLENLSQTEFDFGIQKGVPADVRVAHKIGTNGAYAAENDTGIIFADEPFALCVMTELASATKARQIQADIARIFYEHVCSLQ